MRKLFASLMLLIATSAWATAWPDRPVKIIIPYAAGGTSDIVARTIQPTLSKLLNQTVVIENVPGANGMIGAKQVAQTRDNYTFLLTADEIVPNTVAEPSGEHALSNFRAVTYMAHTPVVLAVPVTSPYATTADLLRATDITFGNGGTRSAAFFTVTAARPGWTSVPYKGGGQMWPDVIAGHVKASAASAIQTNVHVQSGKVRPMLVFAPKRIATMPDVPTSHEMGIPVSGSVWIGILAPRSTSTDAVQRFAQALNSALKDPEINRQLTERGLIIDVKGPQEFDRYLTDSLASVKKNFRE